MELYSPANSIQEAKLLFRAGAGDIYVGGTTTVYSNFKQGSRFTYGEHRLSPSDFQNLIDYCHINNRKVQYVFYTDNLSGNIDKTNASHKTMLDYAAEHMKRIVEYGVDSLVVDDISGFLIAQSLKVEIPVYASFLFDTINGDQAQFFKDIGASGVELSPQLTVSQMTELIGLDSSLDYGIILHLNCAAYEGCCYLDHFENNDGKLIPSGPPCKNRYSGFMNGETAGIQAFLDSTLSCCICCMSSLAGKNINYIKIPGRHLDFGLISYWTSVYNYALSLVQQGTVTPDQIRDLVTEKFPNWRTWCRLNRRKGCLYQDDNQMQTYIVEWKGKA